MKRLLIDIETAPNIAHVWGMFNQNISPKQLQASGYTLCWAAKWYDKKKVMFSSVHRDGAEEMTRRAWELLDEADAVIHYNGARFDIPTLNKEFLLHGLTPPTPYKQIDLLRTIRKQFRFHSNKLDEVLKKLGMDAKFQHKGHELWVECMAGDDKAWRMMERYNRDDVKIMQPLYDKLRPWISNHPNFALYVNDNRPVCNKCGSSRLQKRGNQVTTTMTYQRYQCQECGSWLRERFNNLSKRKRDWVLAEAR